MLDGWKFTTIKQSRHYRLKAQENVMRITFEQGNLLFFAEWQEKRAMLFSTALVRSQTRRPALHYPSGRNSAEHAPHSTALQKVEPTDPQKAPSGDGASSSAHPPKRMG
jgi:hypothetical protein